jgi:hypothetical protein
MRGFAVLLALMLTCLWPGGRAHAQAGGELDRLRGALRQLTAQVRTLEDQRAAMQAKQAESDREKEQLNQQINGLKAQLKDAQDAQQQAVEEFNRRLTERDETLDKWRAAYEEAATVARAKEAERARLEGDVATYKARTTSCEAKNTRLMKVSNQILTNYRNLNLGDVMAIKEPMIGIGAVNHQNKVQDCRDLILDQDAKLPEAPPPAKPQSGSEGGKDQAGRDQAGNDQSGKDQAAKSKEQRPGDRKASNQGNQTKKKDEKVNP